MTSEKQSSPFEQLKNLGKQRLFELKDLSSELFTHISPRDLITMLFPPALGLDILNGKLSGTAFEHDGFDPDAYDPKLMQAVLNMAKWWSKYYFDTNIYHTGKLPSDRPALIVGNHSAGLMPLDALFAINALKEQNGSDLMLYPLVHDFAYMAPRIAKVCKRMGVLRAANDNAQNALQSGAHVLVYPGGDHDAFRTFKERKKIILANRKGFIRLALKTGVPIVPLVSVGLHEAFFVLSKGEGLAKKLGLKQSLRTDVLPLSISFPWGIVPAFFPYLPLPCAIDMEFGDPIEEQGSPDDNDLVDSIYKKVEQSMQKTMDELYKNRMPLLGRK